MNAVLSHCSSKAQNVKPTQVAATPLLHVKPTQVVATGRVAAKAAKGKVVAKVARVAKVLRGAYVHAGPAHTKSRPNQPAKGRKAAPAKQSSRTSKTKSSTAAENGKVRPLLELNCLKLIFFSSYDISPSHWMRS